ncbi:unnamed protein product [Knipowitschia caucasica]|uniref:Clarin 3 n=1 Tax=Knipowitschia caucasica TaxID=637954 RepID=A0AAV2LH50_KNICA
MPSTQKIGYFMACACCSSISVALLGFAMSQTWAESKLKCAGFETEFFNGTGLITWKLFKGNFIQYSCPLISSPKGKDFDVFTVLKESGAPVVLFAVVVLLLVLCLLSTALSILIALYNSVSNPYQTYMGPVGVYICSAISACLSAVVLILFAVTLTGTDAAESVVLNLAGDLSVRTQNRVAVFQLGYFLLLPYTALSLGSIGIIYFYDHAAYAQRREQQRPTEDAPKEIMMY